VFDFGISFVGHDLNTSKVISTPQSTKSQSLRFILRKEIGHELSDSTAHT